MHGCRKQILMGEGRGEGGRGHSRPKVAVYHYGDPKVRACDDQELDVVKYMYSYKQPLANNKTNSIVL